MNCHRRRPGSPTRRCMELPVDRATPPPHPDGFQYEIAFAPADGAARSLVLNEGDVSDALRPVIATAMGRGTLG